MGDQLRRLLDEVVVVEQIGQSGRMVPGAGVFVAAFGA
jgi:hypothetical protein